MSEESKDYQRGYVAGRRRLEKDDRTLAAIEAQRERHEARNERVFLKSLELVLTHCSGWKIDGKTINSAEGYCKLARIFAENSISTMDKMS